MKRQLTIETLPKRLLDEAREMLRGEDTVVEVIRWNGRMRVVGKVFPYEQSWDERVLLTIRETDLFTEAERTENYINYYHKYPSWYTGKRDEAMLERSGCGTTSASTRRRRPYANPSAGWREATSCTRAR